MQLTKLLCLLPFLSISLQCRRTSSRIPEVKDIDHTINRSIRYNWIYIFEYGMYKTQTLLFYVFENWPNVLAWVRNPLILIFILNL
ncbi:hypothetical protein F383_25648 [Gossypium arboreum]|uniref:Uncharacterized protein n=1 Tax=Gossypium arboreum TaxID=29729 RepID=A0A0B0P5B3_GOSAR|nr:hypothetical protein F383_25648 [Gossypium arboreum]